MSCSIRLGITLLFAEGAAVTGFMGVATATFPDSTGFTATPSEFNIVNTIGQEVNFDYQVSSPGSATQTGTVQPWFALTPLAPVANPAVVYADITETAPSVRCDSTPRVGPNTGGGKATTSPPTSDPDVSADHSAGIQFSRGSIRKRVSSTESMSHCPSILR